MIEDSRKYEATITIPIYDHILKIVVVNCIKEYCETTFQSAFRHCSARLIDLIDNDEFDYHFLVVFSYDNATERNINHETNHIVFRIMRDIGCELSPGSEEAFCYLSDYIYDRIRKHTIKAKDSRTTKIVKEIINDTNKRKEVCETANRTTKMETSRRVRIKRS